MITMPLHDALLRGYDHTEATAHGLRPHRLPTWVIGQFPDPQLATREAHPSGVRVAVTTSAEAVELVTHPTSAGYRGIERARGAIDVVVDREYVASNELTGGDALETDLATGETSLLEGPTPSSTCSPMPCTRTPPRTS